MEQEPSSLRQAQGLERRAGGNSRVTFCEPSDIREARYNTVEPTLVSNFAKQQLAGQLSARPESTHIMLPAVHGQPGDQIHLLTHRSTGSTGSKTSDSRDLRYDLSQDRLSAEDAQQSQTSAAKQSQPPSARIAGECPVVSQFARRYLQKESDTTPKIIVELDEEPSPKTSPTQNP